MPYTNYLKKPLTSRVYEITSETALEFAPQISRRIHNHVYLKCEDTHAVFSYKIRGAYNKMAQLTPEQLKKGVITASAGNHADLIDTIKTKLLPLGDDVPFISGHGPMSDFGKECRFNPYLV